MKPQTITEEMIIKIVNQVKQYDKQGIINLDVGQALIVMLTITHIFKFEMDYQKQWHKKYEGQLQKELEQFKTEQGIRNGCDRKE
jgi:hypothetical protein